MSPPRSGQAPRDQLIAIALELLDHHHPEDLSLREVARRAGLTSGAPAHHFGNKLGLLAACAEVAWSDLSKRLESAGVGVSREQALKQRARAYVDYGIDNRGPYRLMTSRRFEDAEQFAPIAAWRKRAMTCIVELIPAPPDDPKHSWRRGFAVWSLLHGHLTLLLDGAIPEAWIEEVVHDVCPMAVLVALLPPQER
ncbi:MAG: TetR/AcrR family transcriptional regulator [Myxococcota bacterium]